MYDAGIAKCFLKKLLLVFSLFALMISANGISEVECNRNMKCLFIRWIVVIDADWIWHTLVISYGLIIKETGFIGPQCKLI